MKMLELLKLLVVCLVLVGFVPGAAAQQSARQPSVMLTPAQVQNLENTVKMNPSDTAARLALMRDYLMVTVAARLAGSGPSQATINSLREDALWFIANDPENEEAAILMTAASVADADATGYKQARAQWIAQVASHKGDSRILANAARFLRVDNPKLATSWLQQAVQADPTNAQANTLLAEQFETRAHGLALRSQSSGSLAQQHKLEEEALTLREAAAKSLGPMERFYALAGLAKNAFRAGEFDKASSYAHELLDTAAQYPQNWNYGNAINEGNVILGRVALRNGYVTDAEQYLVAAATVSGSPQLKSFGPDMSLAKELLAHGERGAVLNYFQMCRSFWTNGGAELSKWTAEVNSGKTPDFGELAR